jgi:hypothetical protein
MISNQMADREKGNRSSRRCGVLDRDCVVMIVRLHGKELLLRGAVRGRLKHRYHVSSLASDGT